MASLTVFIEERLICNLPTLEFRRASLIVFIEERLSCGTEQKASSLLNICLFVCRVGSKFGCYQRGITDLRLSCSLSFVSWLVALIEERLICEAERK